MTKQNIYKPCWIADKLRDTVNFSPVVVLSGARQTGKGTLLQDEPPFKDWHNITFVGDWYDSGSVRNIENLLFLKEEVKDLNGWLLIYTGSVIKQLASNSYAEPINLLY